MPANFILQITLPSILPPLNISNSITENSDLYIYNLTNKLILFYFPIFVNKIFSQSMLKPSNILSKTNKNIVISPLYHKFIFQEKYPVNFFIRKFFGKYLSLQT